MAKVFGASGVKGIDVTTESGTVKYNADKGGLIEVDNKNHLAQMKAEGFAVAGLYSAMNVPGYACAGESCSFVSVFKLYTCRKCGTANDFRD